MTSTESIKLFKVTFQGFHEYESCYCPQCNKYFEESRYLKIFFSNDVKTRWLANLIMHYRHVHTNWDKNKYKLNGNKGVYEKDKNAVNEYIKQVIIKKYSEFLKVNQITKEHFMKLQNTNQQTINLAGEML